MNKSDFESTPFLSDSVSEEDETEKKQKKEEEEQKRKEEEQRKFAEQLKAVKRRLSNEEISPEEYILMLEKRINDLESAEEDLHEARLTIEELTAENEKYKFDLKVANAKIVSLEKALQDLQLKYEEDMAAEKLRHAQEKQQLIEDYTQQIEDLNSEHAQEIENINMAHAQEIEDLNNDHAREIEELNTRYQEEIEEIRQYHAQEIAELTQDFNDRYNSMVESFNEKIDTINETHAQEMQRVISQHEEAVKQLNDEHAEQLNGLIAKHTEEIDQKDNLIKKMEDEHQYAVHLRDHIIETERRDFAEKMETTVGKLDTAESKVKELTALCENLSNLKTLAEGRLNAIRCEYGLIKENEDFTTQEMMEELEHQYEVFRMFHKTEWKKTKKRIRKEVFAAEKAKLIESKQAKQQAKAKKEEKKTD